MKRKILLADRASRQLFIDHETRWYPVCEQVNALTGLRELMFGGNVVPTLPGTACLTAAEWERVSYQPPSACP
jgi:hypothetical protein